MNGKQHIEIKVLGGRDGYRKVETMLVESIDGKIYDAMTGQQITVVDMWVYVKGWGGTFRNGHKLSNGWIVHHATWRAAKDATRDLKKASEAFLARMGGRFESDDE